MNYKAEIKAKTHIIRWLLTAFLLYKVYQETGIWTTIAFFLIMLSFELIAYTIRRLTNVLEYIRDCIEGED